MIEIVLVSFSGYVC